MGHDHHHPSIALSRVNTAFVIGIWLNIIFVVVEAVFGFNIHSMSLLSDAVHNLADVGTLALSLVAFRLLSFKSTDKYTYGYRKTSILVALFNSVILLVSIGGIAIEATRHAFNPQPLSGATVAAVAGVGIAINGITAILFFKEKSKDINIRSAYLHLLSDALVSAAIVVGGGLIYLTSWYWIDSVLSLMVVCFILISTWRLLKESLRLSLDGVPENLSVKSIIETALKLDGVVGLHHVHIWAISSTENAMTAHLVLNDEATHEQEQKIKDDVRHALHHRQIQHITLETERENEPCVSEEC